MTLAKLLGAGRIRSQVERLPLLQVAGLRSDDEQRRAMIILSFVGHAYVWEEADPVQRIPACLAVPWYQVSKRLGRPPVLSYASYALDNWRRLDPEGAIELGNIVLLQNFLGGID
jgi:indoleamine 2,3-dioxygenase